MFTRAFAWFLFGEIVLLGGILLLLPRISRRGLLFGVYVGEEVSGGEDASRIVASWTRGMIAVWAVSLLIAAGAIAAPGIAWASIVASLALPFGGMALYLRSHHEAKALAPNRAVSIAAAPLQPDSDSIGVLPWLALGIPLTLAVVALVYGAVSYDRLPDRIPIHFGADGTPDGWTKKSVGAVIAAPLLGMVLSLMIGVTTFWTARAKRAVRWPGGDASVQAQEGFRRAMVRYLSMIAIVVGVLISWIAIGSVRVGLGEASGLGWGIMVVAGVLIAGTLGGVVYMAIRYGQGGSRIERGADATPLTNGLADDRRWKLGLFYVNREDPSFLVENRFGLGYTLNFGNVRAVVILVTIQLALLGLLVWVIVASTR